MFHYKINFSFPEGKLRGNWYSNVQLSNQGLYRSIPFSKQHVVTKDFEGECYICQGTNHSSNFCWKRRCRQCGAFGHSEKHCPK